MMRILVTALAAVAACLTMHLSIAAQPVLKADGCSAEEKKSQAGMNKIFGSLKSPIYVDPKGKPVHPKPQRQFPPSKAEQDSGMRTIYGNLHSRAYVKGSQTK